MLAVEPGGDAAEELQAGGAGLDVGLRGLLDRPAGVEALQPGNLLGALAQDIGGPAQDLAPLGTGPPGPIGLGAPGRGHGPVHIRLSGQGNPADGPAVGGAVVGEGFSGLRGIPRAVDEKLLVIDPHG